MSESDEDEEIDLSGWSIHGIEEYYYSLSSTTASPRGVIKVKCCPELTPYDAVLLADGEDLTGNRVSAACIFDSIWYVAFANSCYRFLLLGMARRMCPLPGAVIKSVFVRCLTFAVERLRLALPLWWSSVIHLSLSPPPPSRTHARTFSLTRPYAMLLSHCFSTWRSPDRCMSGVAWWN